MKLLVLGTPHGGCIRLAENAGQASAFGSITYFLTPGGQGPTLSLDGQGLAQFVSASEASKPIIIPKDTLDVAVGDYDAVLVSALGASYSTSGNLQLHPGFVHRFRPRLQGLISEALAKQILFSDLDASIGVRFTRSLTGKTRRLLIQPVPLPCESLMTSPEWGLGKAYEDPVGAHRFFCDLRWEYLYKLSLEIGATLLPYPTGDLFSPPSLMQPDKVHGSEAYGALILKQVLAA